MTEVKSTKGIEQNMHSEIGNLVRKAYNEGFADGSKAVKTIDTCSWKQGAEDAWECIIKMLDIMSTEEDISRDDKCVFRALVHTLENADHIDYTRSYVAVRNIGEDKEDELEVGDVVLDPAGHECVITNMDTHIHVIYPSNGKTHKWDKDTIFESTGKHIVGVGKVEI